MIFETVGQFETALQNLPEHDVSAYNGPKFKHGQTLHQRSALGRLEDIASFFSVWQQQDMPCINHARAVIFAGSHGVNTHRISAYPDAVTQQMVDNFKAGGGAINALAKTADLDLHILSLDLERPTQDFTQAPAMDEAECLKALSAGAAMVEDHLDLLVPGEMGIGNTTSASAICAYVFGGQAQDWVGNGTGVDEDGIARKVRVIEAGLALHHTAISSGYSNPFETLRRLGGREIAAMAGAILHAQHLRVPVILDGFISCAAIVPLAVRNPAITNHCLAGHLSPEPGHARLLHFLGLDPLLDLQMRLGEGSGAAIATQIIRSALAVYNVMPSPARMD